MTSIQCEEGDRWKVIELVLQAEMLALEGSDAHATLERALQELYDIADAGRLVYYKLALLNADCLIAHIPVSMPASWLLLPCHCQPTVFRTTVTPPPGIQLPAA